jgi:hypothetical protein
MASAAQVTANIANAQHSSGPRTETGKAASSQNSLKHGLTAQSVLVPGEDEAAYRTMCERMFQSFTLTGEPERILIQILCDTQWRIQRCSRIEAAILSADTIDLKALDTLSKHESRLNKIYNTTFKQARDLIEARLLVDQASLKEAIRIRRADKIKGRPTNFQEIGFVFSIGQVDAAIRREDALAQADITISKSRFDSNAPRK